MQKPKLPKSTRACILVARNDLTSQEDVKWIDHLPKIDSLERLPGNICYGVRDADLAKLIKVNPRKNIICDVHCAIPDQGFFYVPDQRCLNSQRLELLEKLLQVISKKDQEFADDIRSELRISQPQPVKNLIETCTTRHAQSLVELMEQDVSIRGVECYVTSCGFRIKTLFFREEYVQRLNLRWHDEINLIMK